MSPPRHGGGLFARPTGKLLLGEKLPVIEMPAPPEPGTMMETEEFDPVLEDSDPIYEETVIAHRGPTVSDVLGAFAPRPRLARAAARRAVDRLSESSLPTGPAEGDDPEEEADPPSTGPLRIFLGVPGTAAGERPRPREDDAGTPIFDASDLVMPASVSLRVGPQRGPALSPALRSEVEPDEEVDFLTTRLGGDLLGSWSRPNPQVSQDPTAPPDASVVASHRSGALRDTELIDEPPSRARMELPLRRPIVLEGVESSDDGADLVGFLGGGAAGARQRGVGGPPMPAPPTFKEWTPEHDPIDALEEPTQVAPPILRSSFGSGDGADSPPANPAYADLPDPHQFSWDPVADAARRRRTEASLGHRLDGVPSAAVARPARSISRVREEAPPRGAGLLVLALVVPVLLVMGALWLVRAPLPASRVPEHPTTDQSSPEGPELSPTAPVDPSTETSPDVAPPTAPELVGAQAEEAEPVTGEPETADPTATATAGSDEAVDSRFSRTGRLRVVVDRVSKVWVDGTLQGANAASETYDLPEGVHEVKVVAGGRTRILSVRVDPGQVREVRFSFH